MKSLSHLIRQVKKKYPLDKALLFGSRARGDHLLTSDVDVILVSKDFNRINFRKRMAEVLGYWNEGVDLEPLCYTPEEFERKRKEIGIVQQAVKEGILL